MTVSCWYGGLGTRMSCHYQYCMSGAMNNVLSNGNHTNNNNNTAPSSSLSVDAVAVAVAMSWIRHVYGIGRHGNNYKSPSSTSLCVPVLGDWVPLGMYHFFPFSLPLFVLVLVGSSISPVVNSIPYLYLIRTIHSDSSSNSSNANCHQSSVIYMCEEHCNTHCWCCIYYSIIIPLVSSPSPSLSSIRTPAVAAQR